MTTRDEDWAFQETAFGSGRLDIDMARHGVIVTKVHVASKEQDLKQATDYVMETTAEPIALRCRRVHGRIADGTTVDPYVDVTLRSFRNSGADTELDKLGEPNCPVRWYFYAWFDDSASPPRKLRWVLYDVRGAIASCRIGRQKINRDGVSGFRPISISDLVSGGWIKACHPRHWVRVPTDTPFPFRQLRVEDFPDPPEWTKAPWK